MEEKIKILITGSRGFLGKKLIDKLKKENRYSIIEFNEENSNEELTDKIIDSDFIFHFAAVQRLKNDQSYDDNISLTRTINKVISDNYLDVKLIFTSSIHALGETDYGKSKRREEEEVLSGNNRNIVYRLPNIYGSGARVNYTSVVSTFCYNISHNLNIEIHNENNIVKLFYVDDLMDIFINLLNGSDFEMKNRIIEISNFEKITIGDLSRILYLLNEGMDLGYIYKKHGYNFDFLEKLKRTFEWYRDMI